MTIPDGVSPGQRFLMQLPSTARPAVAKSAFVVDGVAAQGGLAAGSRSRLPDSKTSIQATQQEVLRAQQVEQRQRRYQQELAQCEAAKRGSQELLQAAQQAAEALEAAQQADHGSRGRQITPGEKLRLVLATSAVLVHAATCKNASCPVPHCEKMKKRHEHLVKCSTVGCMVCLKLKPLQALHCKHCVATPGEPCVVSWCSRAKRELTQRRQADQRQQLSGRPMTSAAGQSPAIDLTGDDDVPPPPPPPERQRPSAQPGTSDPPATPASASRAKESSNNGKQGPASAPEVTEEVEDKGGPSVRRGGRTRIRPDAYGTTLWYEGPSLCSLLAMRERADSAGREFLVRWRGHSPEEDSWEQGERCLRGVFRACPPPQP